MTKKQETASKRMRSKHASLVWKRIQELRKWQRILVYIISSLLAIALFNTLVDATFKPVKNPNYGVSFSTKYAQELGLDWRKTYIALLDEMKLREFRLMSYWDLHEPMPGIYDFADLDWQIQQAHDRGAEISLSIGMRQPRWPECHQPQWYNHLPKERQDAALLQYLKVTVERYKNHPALKSYQLENEAVNTWFGTCTKDDIRPERLQAEFDLVKALDPHHEVWMSLSDQHGLPVGTPVPDKYGYSVYRIVYNDKTKPFKFYLTYPTPVWYHRLRAAWIDIFKDREIFVHELQLEPWGPEATVNLPVEEQNESMNLRQMEKNVLFARKIGRQDIYTWGGEWWYWRKTVHNDPGPWEKAREMMNKPSASN